MITAEIEKKVIDYFQEYDPVRIGLFGSRVRGDNNPDSDLDILYSINKGITLFDLVQMHDDLKDILGFKVDLVSENAVINPLLKKYIYDDLKIIYEKR
jgi:uncharacterized protein